MSEQPIINPWAGNKPTGSVERVDLPSKPGAYVMAKRPEISELASSGLLAEQDAMSNYVDKNLLNSGNPAKRAVAEKAGQAKALRDGGAMGRLVMALDRLLPLIVVEPVVLCHFRDIGEATERIPEDERKTDPGIAYTDQIDIVDKFHLMSWIESSQRSEPFREESPDPVAGVADVPGLSVPPKRVGRPRAKRH